MALWGHAKPTRPKSEYSDEDMDGIFAHHGYAITDISTTYNRTIFEDLRAIPHTIKFRVLY